LFVCLFIAHNISSIISMNQLFIPSNQPFLNSFHEARTEDT